MALEPVGVSLGEEDDSELRDMQRRFWVSAVLALPVFLVAMAELIPGQNLVEQFGLRRLQWVQIMLASPVVLWGGWPFFVRGWQSVVNRYLNMFTLIALGVTVAFLYSATAVIAPGLFP